jgi:hypothetical protein
MILLFSKDYKGSKKSLECIKFEVLEVKESYNFRLSRHSRHFRHFFYCHKIYIDEKQTIYFH